jgi:hypothetical protein
VLVVEVTGADDVVDVVTITAVEVGIDVMEVEVVVEV